MKLNVKLPALTQRFLLLQTMNLIEQVQEGIEEAHYGINTAFKHACINCLQ